jgi:GTP-binding protein HflX
VESFRNTLQDVFTADLVVLVVDSSEPIPIIKDKVMAVRDVLGRGLMAGELIVALNKIDQGRDNLAEAMMVVRDALEPMCTLGVSALTGEGIDALIAIIDSYFRPPITVNVAMRNDAGAASEVSWLYDSFFVESVEYGDDVKVAFRCASDEVDRVMERLRSLPGTKWVSTATDDVDDN